MKKRLFIFLLTAVAAVCCIFAFAGCGGGDGGNSESGGENEGGSTAELVFTERTGSNSSFYMVSGVNGEVTEINIPSTYNGLPVKTISENAFRGCETLKKVTVPDSINTVGAGAFEGCVSLESIVIPEGVISIGGNAFLGCTALKSAVLGDSVTELGKEAFKNCSNLESITCNGEIQAETDAFKGCTALKTIILPNIKTNGTGLFADCANAASATLPAKLFEAASFTHLKTVTVTNGDLSPSAFKDCTDLSGVTLAEGVTGIGESAFEGCTALKTITLPNSVTHINTRAFKECTNLENVTFGAESTLETISWNVFEGCTGLTEIEVPKSVTKISKSSFKGTNIKNVIWNAVQISYNDGIVSISDPVFENAVSVTFGNEVQTIPVSMFYKNENLETVEFEAGSTLKTVGGYAFIGCTGLKTITLPNSVAEIGASAFEGCTGLVSADMGDGVTKIKESAFKECTGLTKVEIPKSVTSIGADAFIGCKNIEGVYISNIDAWCQFRFSINSRYNYECDNPLFYAHNLYINNELAKDIEIAETTEIKENTFTGCTNIETIKTGDKVTAVGRYAFKDCTGLKSITVGKSVESIDSYSFDGCTGIEKFEADTANTEFTSRDGILYNISSHSVFAVPAAIKGPITIPKDITDLSFRSFAGKSGITAITFEPGSIINYISQELFSDCTGIESLVLPDSVTYIGDYAFIGCSGLKSVTLPDGIQSINGSAFSLCNNIVTATGPAIAIRCIPRTNLQTLNVTCGDISAEEFISRDKNNKLTSITIGKGVTSIGQNAFLGCNNLVEVINLSSLPIVQGKTDNGYVAYYALNVVNSADESKIKVQDDFKFYADGDGAYLLGYFGEPTDLELPETFGGEQYGIYKYAFYKNDFITEAVLPDGVTSVGDYAFSGCESLASVTIGDGVTQIGGYAFAECANLKSVAVGKGVKSIAAYAFIGCEHLTGVYITDIAAWCDIEFGINAANPLYYAPDLYLDNNQATHLEIPQGVKEIKAGAFSGCTNLISITIPESVTSIGDGAFLGCINLVEVINLSGLTIVQGTKDNGYVAYNALSVINGAEQSKVQPLEGYEFYDDGKNVYLLGYYGDQTELELPDTFDGKNYQIYQNAFANNQTITKVILPDTVTYIGTNAFSNCNNLKSVVIGNGVTEISKSVFWNCKNLESVTIGNGVTKIDNFSFSGCTNMTGVYISDMAAWCNIDFKKADNYISNPLYYAHNLYLNGELVTELEIPREITSIYAYTFLNCTSITSVNILGAITYISTSAFYECSNLESVRFADNSKLTRILENAFVCSGLTGVYISDLAAWCNTDMENEYSNPLCFAHSLYLNNSLITELAIPTEVTEIGAYTFVNCTDIISASLPETVTYISTGAFSGCINLQRINIPKNITSFPNSVFSGCQNLKSIDIPAKLTYIGQYAFRGCKNISQISLPSTLKTIRKGAFRGCESIVSVSIPNTVTTFEEDVFMGCINLNKVTVSTAITVIPKNTFKNCESLTSVTWGSNVTKIDEEAFSGCTSLTDITITRLIKTICERAFYKCENLKTVTFEDTARWFVYNYGAPSSGGYVSGTPVSVIYPDANARYFTSNYCYYRWIKSNP